MFLSKQKQNFLKLQRYLNDLSLKYEKIDYEIMKIQEKIENIENDITTLFGYTNELTGQKIDERIAICEKEIRNQKNTEETQTKIIGDHEKGIQMCINGINEDRVAIQKIIKKITDKPTSTKTKRR